jgi:long-subunit fatty acid transport protein
MRKILTLIAGTLITGNLLAGGLVTNTNQSAAWVRMPSRNASTQIDAVYYNPAGLMKMENGFHFGLNNQTISQTRTITSTYPYLNSNEYKGTVFAPFFPSIYAAFKMNKFAVSLGFMPIGGGGGATYETGLPSFEMGISDLVPMLSNPPTDYDATAYDVDIFFEGSSLFLGYQGAISYKINDFISIAAGARYVTAKNTYTGHLQDVMVTMGGNDVSISEYFLGIASNLTSFIGVPTLLAPALPTYGGLTLAQAQAGGILNATQRAGIEAGLTGAIGLSQATVDAMTLNQVSGTITGATPAITPQIAKANATGTLTADKTADVTQTGSGIAPFFSVNISPMENLNIAIKYEMATKLELVNETKQDLLIGYTATGTPITQFPDGEKFRNDMPATLTIGAELKLDKIKIAAGGNYYFDKSANYGHKWDHDLSGLTPTVYIDNSEIIKNNGLALHCAAELGLGDKMLVSAGYAWANLGVNKLYQSDLTFANATHTIGLGGAYNVNDKIRINIGGGYTMYIKDSKTVNHLLGETNVLPTESYTKKTMMLGIGLDLSF